MIAGGCLVKSRNLLKSDPSHEIPYQLRKFKKEKKHCLQKTVVFKMQQFSGKHDIDFTGYSAVCVSSPSSPASPGYWIKMPMTLLGITERKKKTFQNSESA